MYTRLGLRRQAARKSTPVHTNHSAGAGGAHQENTWMRLPVLPASTITPYAFGFWVAAWLPHANSTTATDAATR